jgi:hypothetical protein
VERVVLNSDGRAERVSRPLSLNIGVWDGSRWSPPLANAGVGVDLDGEGDLDCQYRLVLPNVSNVSYLSRFERVLLAKIQRDIIISTAILA